MGKLLPQSIGAGPAGGGFARVARGSIRFGAEQLALQAGLQVASALNVPLQALDGLLRDGARPGGGTPLQARLRVRLLLLDGLREILVGFLVHGAAELDGLLPQILRQRLGGPRVGQGDLDFQNLGVPYHPDFQDSGLERLDGTAGKPLPQLKFVQSAQEQAVAAGEVFISLKRL